jgi:hypothetical protein
LGETTPKELYEVYCWHERIEVAGGDEYKGRSFHKEDAPNPVRKIYATDQTHPLIGRRAEGETWSKADYATGYVHGIHFDNDEPTAIHISDGGAQTYFCKEFVIFTPEAEIESDGWWKVHPPFFIGQQVYFLGFFRGQNPPFALCVRKCEFVKDIYLTGYWQITATLALGSPEKPREIGVAAASWMFQMNPELPPDEEGYCYQVRQYYHDYEVDPGYTTAVTGLDLPCYRTEEEAIAFLQSTTFPGGVIRHVMRRGLDTGVTAGVVYERFEGTRDYTLARRENALLLNQAGRKAHKLVRNEQTHYPNFRTNDEIDKYI